MSEHLPGRGSEFRVPRSEYPAENAQDEARGTRHSVPGTRSLRTWRIVFVIYLLALTSGTHWPRLELGTDAHPAPDKLLHLFAFAGLTILLWRTRWLGDRWMLLFVLFGWAAVDEWTQGLPGLGRTPNHADMLANWIGILLAFAWIRTMRPVGGPLNRLRLARNEMLADVLILSRRSWLLAAAISIPAAILVGAGAALVTWYVDSELLLHGTLLGAIAGGGTGLFAALDRALRELDSKPEAARPCFSCGHTAGDVGYDEHGLGKCPSCGIALHEAQWRLSLSMPRRQLIRAARPAVAAAVGLAAVLVVAYAAVLFATLNIHGVRTVVVDWLPMQLRMALDLALIGFVLAAAFRVFRRSVAKRFDGQDRICRHCNHDVSATQTVGGIGRCGECGTQFIRLPDPPPTLAGTG